MKLFIKLLSSISLSEFILIVQTTILFLEYKLKIIDRKRKNAVNSRKDSRRLSVHHFPRKR